MKAVLFPGDGEIELVDLPDPEPGPGEVVIQMQVSGICGTDLHYMRETPEQRGSKRGIVPGHEAAGVIVAVGPGVVRRKVGDRVVGYHHVGCNHCHYCRLGVPTQCPNKTVVGRHIHGSDGQYEVLPEHGVFVLPDDFSFVEGAIIACNFSTAYSALMKVPVDARSRVAVLGQGGVGLCATMIAAAFGAKVAAVDLSDNRLARSKEMGAELILNPKRDDVTDALKRWNAGRGPDVVVECSGSSTAIAQGMAALAPLGSMVFVGAGGAVNADVGAFRSPEQRLLGTSVYRPGEYEPMLRLIRDNGLDLGQIVEGEYSIDEAREAFDVMLRQDTGKALFRWA
ncbi:MAG: alcohol dehydrogenase catalytic domain-containing protein [Trueperaceae bacterium]|nr:alcohol dehydrogenase catalytic domain-containing protein [Trueperaceae bacterium]